MPFVYPLYALRHTNEMKAPVLMHALYLGQIIISLLIYSGTATFFQVAFSMLQLMGCSIGK